MSLPRAFTYLLLALTPFILLAVHLLPFTHAESDFWHSMNDVLRTGHTPTLFLPGFYSFVCALFYKPFGAAGVELLQAAMYLALAACVLLILRTAAGPRPAATVAAVLILLDPDLLSSIPKLWDTEATALLLAALVLLSFAVQQTRRTVQTLYAALLGTVWGLSLAVRPNFALLAVPIGYALWSARARLGAALTLATAPAFLFAANTLAHGSFYLPGNGPYNLFAGANPFTAGALLSAFNAEPSIPQAMALHGFPLVWTDFYQLGFRPLFTRYALDFIAGHPFQWLGYGALKLWTLLRSDTKAHPLPSAWGLLKVLTALAVPFWLAVLAFLRPRPLTRTDRLFLLFTAFYVLPFVLTNADPRFRPALDVLVLTHAASLLLRRARAGRTVVQGEAVEAVLA